MFFWNSLALFNDPVDVGNLISGSSAFSKTSLNIWKFTVYVLLKPGLENFEHYFTSVWSEVAQSCPTLCDPMDYSLPGSSVHGIFQAIVLEWIAISFSRGSSRPRNWTPVSCIVDRHSTVWATGKSQTSVWDEGNCVVVWAFFDIAFLWDWNENWPFPVLWPLLSFQICWHIECSTFTASPQDLKQLNWNSITSTSLVCSNAS